MSENKEKKDQFVIAYLNNLDFAKTCIEHSVQIAKILNKGLILLHIYDPLLTKVGVDEAESKLKELNSQITETQMHSYISLKGETKEVISKLGQLLNAVVIVSSINTEETNKNKADNPITLLKNMETSRVAYMICNQKRSIVKPVDTKVDIPIIDKRVGQVLSIQGDNVQLMDMESYETLDLEMPEDLKDQIVEGIEVEYIVALGNMKIMRTRGSA